MPSISSGPRWMRGHVVLAATLLGAALAAACGGSNDSSTTPIVVKDVTPATITSDVTTPLTGVVGTQVNTVLGVTVLNKANAPIDSAVVTFAVTSGGGTVSNTTVRTTGGKASTTWTLGPTVGTQTVTATVGTLAPVTFTATATAGAAKNIAKLSTDPQTAVSGSNVAVAPSVKVTDANGNPVSGVLVTFAVASGGGSVVGGLANTDANGVATATSWRLGNTVGTNTVTATAAGITTPVTFTATGTVGAAASIQITNTAPTLSSGGTFTYTTVVRDANNNTLTNPSLNWTSSNTAVATVSAAGVVTAVNPGSATISAAIGTVTAQQTVTVIGHPATAPTVFNVPLTSAVAGLSVVNNTAYVAQSTSNAVAIIDLPSATLTSSVDLSSRTVDVAASSSAIAVATINPSLIWFLNAAGQRTDSIELEAAPVKIAMTSNGSKLFADLNNFAFKIIDVPSRTVTATLALGGTPAALKVATGDSLAYMITRLGTLFEISVATGTVRRTIQTSLAAVDFAVSPDGKTMFIADGTPTVTILRLAAGGMADGNVTFQNNVTAVGVTPDGGQLWAGYLGNIGVVRIINGNFDVIQPMPIANINPGAIAFNKFGSVAAILDVSVNQLVILK